MLRILILIFFLFLSFFLTSPAFAKSENFVSVVNPIRGADFWNLKNQKPEDVVKGQVQILKQYNLEATWLIRFDALSDQTILSLIPTSDEKGLFLEVIPSWSKESGIEYHHSKSWHAAGSAFLTGYELSEREKLIDTAFDKFKKIFGVYPKSVGAWWIGSYSLNYMQKKYGITTALIVADQYSTDNYQIWGQYFSTPYYPSKKNALHPSQTLESKLPVVITQWAPRDPFNAYGNGVFESTFSTQANDYLDYHNLDTKYFSKLVDIYTNQPLNKFSHLVVGLENSYSWQNYKNEYENQIKTLVDKRERGQFKIIELQDFANWYQNNFPNLSPEQIIVADDPLGSFKKVVWFMNPYYRAGWFYITESGTSSTYTIEGSVFRDIRQYIDGQEELCFKRRCDEVNFATTATRVLDEVSFGHRLRIDNGKISDLKVNKSEEKYLISYKNEAGTERKIEFLQRDINIDGKISSIDNIILEATRYQLENPKQQTNLQRGFFKWSFQSSILKLVKFLGFLIFGCLIPGSLLINKILNESSFKTKQGVSFIQKMSLSLVLGFAIITLLFYLLSLINLKQIIFVYLFISVTYVINLIILMSKTLLRIKNQRQFFDNFSLKVDKFHLLVIGLIVTGTVFQQLPTFKNGLIFPYGMGFWGPNTHDGIWHVALINQLTKTVPPQNPVFAGEVLKNYHYFYDLLVACASYITWVPILDLLFRFFPIIFSVTLGISTYYLTKSIFKNVLNLETKLGRIFALYIVYFAGSFGWIVEYIKFKHLGGESAFWANQSISFNLNPPFAVSLLMVIAILQLISNKSKSSILTLVILCGTLISFKSYAAILILLTFLLVGLFKRHLQYLLVFLVSSVISTILFLANFSLNKQLIIFSPFWFIHSMIDSPDRVGWTRVTLARAAGLEQYNWFKFLLAETISLIIFIIGNLGTRLFALFSLIKIKSIFDNTQYLFLFTLSSLSLITPIFFIQAGNPWNTIQFIYYFLYTSAIIGGLVFARIIIKIPKIIAVPVSLVFVLITPINSWASANGYLNYQPHALVSEGELEGLEFLKTQENGIILTYPYDKGIKAKITEPWPLSIYDSTAYVAALSEKAVYLEDEGQNQILLTDYNKRLVSSKDFFSRPNEDFLINNKIKYIYLPKITNVRLSEKSLPIINTIENDEVIIYRVKE